jgi:TRAP-type C4-dicarboxylate transport system permease small subunit
MARSTTGAIGNLANGGAALAAAAIVLSTILVLAEVVARSVFHTSTLISVEFSSYLLIVVTFLGLAYTQKSGQMIHVDVLFGALSPHKRAWADALRHTVMLVYAAITLCYVGEFTWRSYALDQVSSTLLRTPQYIPQLFMVVGLALLTVVLIKGSFIAWRRALRFDEHTGQ